MVGWRQDFFAKHFTKDGLGLEIGPSHTPIAQKRDGYNVEIVDHADYRGLVKKYKALNINTSKIEEVDYVWDGHKTLSELIKKPKSFDYVIASHVIEHTTDIVQFLQDCENLLKPSGKLCLAIPDKRYCFDYFRFPTVAWDAVEAFEHKNVRHTPAKVFDFFSNHALLSDKAAWSSQDTGSLSLSTDIEEALKKYKAAQKNKEYIDIHNWLFTPKSFRLLLSDFQALKLSRLSYVDELPTQGFEFFVILSPKAPFIKHTRLELVNGMMDDVRTMLGINTAKLQDELKQARKQLAAAQGEIEKIKQSKRWRYAETPTKALNKIRPKA